MAAKSAAFLCAGKFTTENEMAANKLGGSKKLNQEGSGTMTIEISKPCERRVESNRIGKNRHVDGERKRAKEYMKQHSSGKG